MVKVMADVKVNVEGYCPMGCGATLFVGDGGYITCSYVHCPKPEAAHNLLKQGRVRQLLYRAYLRCGQITSDADRFANHDLESV